MNLKVIACGVFEPYLERLRPECPNRLDFAILDAGLHANPNELRELAQKEGLSLEQTIAVGDGANDLPMMAACTEAGGLSVAYHAKPKVREQAMVAIQDGGLDRLLDVLR